MSGWLRRFAIWIRLTLVCAALIGTSAPLPAIVHAEVAMFVASAQVHAASPPAVEVEEQAASVASPHDTPETTSAPATAHLPPARPDAAPRRLFILHCALLC